MGIEPTYPAWKAGVLPLNYTRRARPANQPADHRRPEPGPAQTFLLCRRLEPARNPQQKPPENQCFATYRSRSTGGGGRIRTYEGISRQIYSLLPLAAWVPLREQRAAYSHRADERCQCMSYRTTGAGRWSRRAWSPWRAITWRLIWRRTWSLTWRGHEADSCRWPVQAQVWQTDRTN